VCNSISANRLRIYESYRRARKVLVNDIRRRWESSRSGTDPQRYPLIRGAMSRVFL
jgi:hypothetical protein